MRTLALLLILLTGAAHPLPACPTEDSDNCHWNASTHGNGVGHSFTVINGEVHYTH